MRLSGYLLLESSALSIEQHTPPSLVGFFSLRLCLKLFLVLSLLAGPGLVLAADLEAVPTKLIENRIESIQSDVELSDDDKSAAVSLLQRSLTQNKRAKDANALSAEYDEALKNPEAYGRRDRIPPAGTISQDTLENSTQDQLASLLLERQIQLSALDTRRKTLENNARAERTADTQGELASLRSEAPATEIVPSVEPESMSAQKIFEINSEVARTAQMKMLEKRALSRAARLEQWQKELDYIVDQSAILKSQISDLQARNASARQSAASDRTGRIKELISKLPVEDQKPATEGVLARAYELEDLATIDERLEAEAAAAQENRSRLQQRSDSVTQQLDLFRFKVSPEFGAALRAQRDQITSTQDVSNRVAELEEKLTQGRLRQFQLDDLQLQQRFKDAASRGHHC